MKTFACALLFCLAGIVGASAQSPYVGQYYALSYSGGNVVAAVNIKVKQSGAIVGHGSYVDFYGIDIKGQVDDDGTFTIAEHSARYVPPYTGTFAKNGNKFTADLSTGNIVKGTRVPKNFKVAGAYIAEIGSDYEGLFIVSKNHKILGGVYNKTTQEVTPVTGVATIDGFSGSTSTGVNFMGTFQGKSISGSYSDGGDFNGNFLGKRF